ncbi:hypothetical protein J14TS2_53470 [Bacillus sp. J14TS2]|uniref:ABC transporter substrate-binding protein n=1 Tax=Bacillus sp. J14TS2 TaxID=2807188 RepID=UPI001AFF2F00|nr:extracellular solute-binding protein [Bacillus sp. J14TS2]GIN74872.1 hypothetical protein J14TS2_53470 [Bacillus sp. J14TS2]
MREKSKLLVLFIVIGCMLAFVTACGNSNESVNGDNNDNKKGDDTEKVEETNIREQEATIRWAHQWGEEEFLKDYGDLLKEEFPNVTIEVQEAGTDHPETLENIIAAGKSPDIVTLGIATHIQFMDELGLAYNHDEIVDKAGFDISKLEPSIVEYTRKQDPNDEGSLYAIPNSRPTWALHYNKDVFDTFGVNYPEDGMTWEEIVELAKDLTGERNGVEYRGLDLDVPYDAWTQFSTQAVDPDTDEVNISGNDDYKRFFQMIEDTISIPGNYPTEEPGSLLMNWGAEFGKDNVAMAPSGTNWGWLEKDNIDIATYPVWEGYEGLNPQPNSGGFAITEPSEHKELIMEMIAYLLSDEVQMEKSKQGTTSILVNPDVQAAFGEGKPEISDKHLQALFENGYATGPDNPAKYGSIPWGEFEEFANSGKDVNEYLRQYEEQMTELVERQKAQE